LWRESRLLFLPVGRLLIRQERKGKPFPRTREGKGKTSPKRRWGCPLTITRRGSELGRPHPEPKWGGGERHCSPAILEEREEEGKNESPVGREERPSALLFQSRKERVPEACRRPWEKGKRENRLLRAGKRKEKWEGERKEVFRKTPRGKKGHVSVHTRKGKEKGGKCRFSTPPSSRKKKLPAEEAELSFGGV